MVKYWDKIAVYCEDTYGVFVDWEERFFLCPECGEPIYECDWNTEDMFDDGNIICPICEEVLGFRSDVI